MQQLTEMDSNFLQQESARTPMHISPVIIYDQSARDGGKVRFKEILTVFERNLHKSAIFRRKLAGGAMGLDTPYWVEDRGLRPGVSRAPPRPAQTRRLAAILHFAGATAGAWTGYEAPAVGGLRDRGTQRGRRAYPPTVSPS